MTARTPEEIAAEILDSTIAILPKTTAEILSHNITVALGKAVEAEREACARIAHDHGEFCRSEAMNGGHVSLHERATDCDDAMSRMRFRLMLRKLKQRVGRPEG